MVAAKKLLDIEGVQQHTLAQLLNVSDSAINHIASARTWGYLEIDADGDATETDEAPARAPWSRMIPI